MLKKIITVFAMIMCVCAFSFADVSVKDLDGTNVAITFTFRDDAATEMSVIGSFDNWTEPGESMTKNSDGLWEYTLNANKDDEITYKFWYKGTYIFDFKAPDKKDDGFGGNNGLIIPADILASSGASGAAGVAGAAGAAADKYPSKLNFSMHQLLGVTATALTQGVVDKSDKGFEMDSAGVRAKGYWKIGGSLLPDFTTFMELKIVDTTSNFYKKDATGAVSPELATGLSNLLAGALASPVNYLSQGLPVLNGIRFGIETPYVLMDTGYGYYKTSGRSMNFWSTIDEVNSNDGYLRFDSGSKVQNIGSATVNAMIMATRANGNLNLVTFANSVMGNYSLGFQYDYKSQATSDITKMFDAYYHQDIMMNASAKFAPITVKTDMLLNVFNGDFNFLDNYAAQVAVEYANSNNSFGTTVGYRWAGEDTSMLFGKNSDNFTAGTQYTYLNIWANPLTYLNVGVDSGLTIVTDKIDSDGFKVEAKPYVNTKLDSFTGKTSFVNVYAKIEYNFELTDDNFYIKETGLRFGMKEIVPGVLKNFETTVGFDNRDSNKSFTTLFLTAALPKDSTVELGLGYRACKKAATEAIKEANNPLAFSVGGSWKVPVRAIKTPTLYGAFVYNMDPYTDNEMPAIKWDGYILNSANGVNNRDGYAQFRVMLKWEF